MISLGGQAPHVLRARMGHTCGWPNEIELIAAHELFYRSLSGPWSPTRGSTGSRSTRREPFNFTPMGVNRLRLALRTYARVYVWCLTARRNQGKYPPEIYILPLFVRGQVRHAAGRTDRAGDERVRIRVNAVCCRPIPLYYPKSPCKKGGIYHRWRKYHVAGNPTGPATSVCASAKSCTRAALHEWC